MNGKKLKQLLESARQAASPAPPPDFAADVLRAVRREPAAKLSAPLLVFDYLNLLFPQVALAAVAIIVLCATVDLTTNLPGVGDGAAQMSSQLFFKPINL